MNRPDARRSSSIRLVKLGGALLLAPTGGAILLPSYGSDSPPPVGTYAGSTPDARNYRGIAAACRLFPDFGFGECMNQIARSEIELSPFGGGLGVKARSDCVKQAGSDCVAAKKCIGRVTGSDTRCTDPAVGAPFDTQPRSFCGADNRITVCNETGTSVESFSCADEFAKQHFGVPFACRTPRWRSPASRLSISPRGHRRCGEPRRPVRASTPEET